MTTIWVCYAPTAIDESRPERVFSKQEDASDWLMNYAGLDYIALEFDLETTRVTGRFLAISNNECLLTTVDADLHA